MWKPAAERKTARNGFYVRKHWATTLGPLQQVRIPRCRDAGLTQRMFARLENHRDALGQSAVDMLLAGVSTRRVGELLERIIEGYKARMPDLAQAVSEEMGAPIFNPHRYTLEEGGMKQTDETQLAFKREADPQGLLNPGKMIAWEDPSYDYRSGKTFLFRSLSEAGVG